MRIWEQNEKTDINSAIHYTLFLPFSSSTLSREPLPPSSSSPAAIPVGGCSPPWQMLAIGSFLGCFWGTLAAIPPPLLLKMLATFGSFLGFFQWSMTEFSVPLQLQIARASENLNLSELLPSVHKLHLFLHLHPQGLALIVEHVSLCAVAPMGTFERVERAGGPAQEVPLVFQSNFSFRQLGDMNHSPCPPWWIKSISKLLNF